jgi:hypothetical protein
MVPPAPEQITDFPNYPIVQHAVDVVTNRCPLSGSCIDPLNDRVVGEL